MHDVLHVPDLAANLFLVSAAANKGTIVQFGHTRCWLKDSNGHVRAMGTLEKMLYYLDCEPIVYHSSSVAADTWHQRLPHVGSETIRKINRNNAVIGGVIPSNHGKLCKACLEGKMSRKPFKTVGEIRSKRRLQLVYSDVCSMEVDSIGGSRYSVTFIDDFSRCCAVYFIKHKSEVLAKFRLFQAEMSNHTKETIQCL